MIVFKGDRVIVITTMELGRQVAEQDAFRLLGILAGLRDLSDQIRVHKRLLVYLRNQRRGHFRADRHQLPNAEQLRSLS